MPLITRAEAVARVKQLPSQHRRIAWALSWDYPDIEIAEVALIPLAAVREHIATICQVLQCDERGIGLVMALGEGIRTPEFQEWPMHRTPPQMKKPIGNEGILNGPQIPPA